MDFITKYSNQLMNYFIGELLSQTNESLEQSKIEMFYWYCLLNIFPMLMFIPYLLNGQSYVQISYVIGTIFFLIGNIFYLKFFKSYKKPLLFLVVLSPILVWTLMLLMLPSDLSILLTFIYIIISLAIFTLDNRWTFAIVAGTIITIGITAYLKSIGLEAGDLIGVEMVDQTPIEMSSMLKIGFPMILMVLALVNFVRVSKAANARLVENIKKQQTLNRELELSRSQFKRLVEGADDMVYELTLDGIITYVNPSIERVIGFEANYYEGLKFTKLIHPNVVDAAQKYFVERKSKPDSVFYEEYPIVSKDGKTVWVGQKTNVVRDDSGAVEKYFCIARDITKQREIRKNLEKAKNEAEKAALIKASFLSAISHEIRTPINAVLGTIHLMEDENPRSDQLTHLKTLKFSAESLMGLVSHILDFNRLDTELVELKNAPFNLKRCLMHTRAGVAEIAANKGINFSVEIDENLPEELMGDSLRLSQVLSNLAHNAVKFTEEGSVNLQAVEHLRRDDFVQVYFSVTDTGQGIPQEKLKVIFEKFTQANEDTIRQGTGLGLAISKKIVSLFNSEIKVESIENKGSKFAFMVEFQKVNKAIQKTNQVETSNWKAHKKNLANTLKGLKVLLVEDNLINQKVAGKLLSGWGAEFTVAGNGKIAVEKIQEEDYDIVLMDIQMPVMDGIRATIAIRAMGGNFTDIPIVALTASDIVQVRQSALEAGLNDFLTKPFLPQVLNKTILKYVQPSSKIGEQSSLEMAMSETIPGPTMKF